MKSDSVTLGINQIPRRNNTQCYECSKCHSHGETVAEIQHKEQCPYVTLGEEVTVNPGVIGRITANDVLTDELVDTMKTINRQLSMWALEDRDWEAAYDALKEIDGVKWWSEGSTSRIILGLGKTSTHGQFYTTDRRGLVLKVDPRIRYNTNTTPTGSNIDELRTWRDAVRTDTTELFADIFAAAPDGMWLVMEECMPIAQAVRQKMKTRDIYYDRDKSVTRGFLNELTSKGWKDPDYKHENIGYTDNGDVVLLDFGTGPRNETITE